jgi:fido (protein-threonine AMPylation protein)
MSSPARIVLDNLRPSRARGSVARTLRREELEERLDRLARTRGEGALNELRDEARAIAPALGGEQQFAELDRLLGALLGTREAPLRTPAARARHARMGYDADRLVLFEALRAELASQSFAQRAEPPDPERLLAFFEAYFSNWIEGTVFEVSEAEEIVFEGRVPPQRPADAHDIQGTFDAVTDPRPRRAAPRDAADLEDYLRSAHRRITSGRPDAAPGEYKERGNRAGMTFFVHPDLVRGTLREGFSLLDTLPGGLPRAIFAMFMVAEVHPFADGNGRVARLLMNAELTAQAQCRVMIPLSYRDEYISALRALSQNANPIPVWRMIDRAQRWASQMTWTDPDQAAAQNVHLLDPV